MRNILRQLHNGEIYPDDELIPRDKEYHSTMAKIRKERDYFKTDETGFSSNWRK